MAATSSSSHEVGTSSPSDDFDPRNLASRCNLIACLEVDKAPSEIQIMVEFLCHHDLNIPLTKQAQVPISLLQRAYHTARYFKEEDRVEFNADAKNSMKLDKSRFLKAIGFPDIPKEERNIKEPTYEELFDMLEKMNYLGGRLGRTRDFRKTKLPAVWQYLIYILLRCLSGKGGVTDTLNRGTLCILYGLYYDKDVDIGDILWKDFITYIEPKKAEIRHGRFWGLILKLCYKELNLEMPKGELAVFRTINKFIVSDQSSFWVVNPIPKDMLKYIPTTSTVLSSYLKAMDQSKSSQATPSGKGNTKRQNLETNTVTWTFKRKHESSRNSRVKSPTKKPTPPTPSQQGDDWGRKAAEESLKRIEEIERKAFEESEKKKKTDEGHGDTDEDVLEVNFAEGGKHVAPENDSDSGFTLFTKIDDENKILLDDSSAESTKRSEEIKASQGTSESLSETRKRSKGSKYVSKKKFKQMEKTLNEVLEFVRHIPTAADVYTPRADFTKLLDTVTLLSKTVEDMNARQKKLHDEMSTTVAKEAMIVIDKLNAAVNAVNNWQKLYDSSLNSLGKTHGEEINRFSTRNSELRKQNIVLHSVVVKILKSLEILAKSTPQPSEVLSVLKSMQITVEDLPKQLSSEPLKKHFDEAFAKLSALMTDTKVFGQEKGGEEGSLQGPIVISKDHIATPLTIPGSSIFEDKEKGGEAEEEEKEKTVVEIVQKPLSLSPQKIEEPEVTPEKPKGSPRTPPPEKDKGIKPMIEEELEQEEKEEKEEAEKDC